ncbi:hypothetical protein FGADI_11985 [Fusarium gaditjirri]|uniref:Heterokaryon incompatibility domain-containing protein n=1 Tax=Fusarium gaditjirri TaxID=282569 RepID=A0A8H4STJ6_9HYPO|nr:hypothetical protein FGADI_11985 [Fusarium gaditjirri]
MSGIFVADLPKTFQNAVSVCRYLEIPYLWIDSLCIIQGDPEDWARESPQMMNVYTNAYVVIAANHASDSRGGCFHIRPSRVKANVTLPSIGLVHAQLCANSNEVLCDNTAFYDKPLSKRAWALQERFLAARTIYYNTGQMYFECRHGMVGEDGCKTNRRYCDMSPGMNHRYPACKAIQLWSAIIWIYGERNLTKPTDKLPALSGVASLLGGMLKDEYIAGLWSSMMVQGLAWKGQWRPNPQPINEYIGPSWSWASFQGIAALDYDSRWRSIAIVEGWKVELTNPSDPYGQIKSASVRVRGPIIQLTQSTILDEDRDERLKRTLTRPRPRFCTKYSRVGDDMELNLDNGDPNASDEWGEMDMKVLLLGGDEITSRASQCEVQDEEAESRTDESNWESELSYGFGLVLTSVEMNGAVYMKRVGWIYLDSSQVEKLRQTKEDWDIVTII